MTSINTNHTNAKVASMIKQLVSIVAAVVLLAASSGASAGYVVSEGLMTYFDFTKAPDIAGDLNGPGGIAGANSIYKDKAGSGNTAKTKMDNLASTGSFHDPRDPRASGPLGPGVALNGGWLDIIPNAAITDLTTGTIELQISSHPGIDNSCSYCGTPLQGSHTLDDGFANGWEMWIDRRSSKRAFATGRIGGVDKLSTLAGPGLLNNSLRDQLVIRFDGDDVEFFVRTYNYDATEANLGDPSYTSTGGQIDTATGMAMLQGLDLLRIGARNNESEAHIPAGGNPDSIMHASTFADVFRIYDRQLTDAELLQNFTNFNGAILRIPEPATLTLLATGGLTLLRRRRAA